MGVPSVAEEPKKAKTTGATNQKVEWLEGDLSSRVDFWKKEKGGLERWLKWQSALLLEFKLQCHKTKKKEK